MILTNDDTSPVGQKDRAVVATGVLVPATDDDRPRRTGPRWSGWLAVGAVAALPFSEALRIIVTRSPVVLDGDEALLDLGTRRAGDLLQLVGPYSRVGFHQPGPAVYYLLAPFLRLLGGNDAGLFLGATAISGGALIATVALLWRLVGPQAALWAAAAIDGYCLCLQVGTLREPWNPYLVVTPMVLFVVLWAAGSTGRPGAGLWAVVIGSYEVQTHIATAGFVVTMSLIMVVRIMVARTRWSTRQQMRRPPPGGRRWGPSRIVGVAALVLIWVPSTVELWRDHPNNATVLWDYFMAPHATPTLHQALDVAANAITILPFGYHDYSLALTRSPAQLAMAAVLIAAGISAAFGLGVRRRQPLSIALATSAVLGMVLGALSLLLAAAPLYLYFAVWLAFVPLSLLLAIGIALFAPPTTLAPATLPPATQLGGHSSAPPLTSLAGGRRWLGLCAVAALGFSAVAVHSDLSMASFATTSGAGPWPLTADGSPQARTRAIQDTASLSAAVESVLRPSDRRVGFDLGPASPWPFVAGMVLALNKRGVQSTVAPASWELYFGDQRAPDHPVTVRFDLHASGTPASQRTAGETTIEVIDGYILTYERTAG